MLRLRKRNFVAADASLILICHILAASCDVILQWIERSLAEKALSNVMDQRC